MAPDCRGRLAALQSAAGAGRINRYWEVPFMSLEPVGSPSTNGAVADRSNPKKFVVLATPRSGSSHLVDLLDSHPQLSCLGELFNPHGAALRKLGLRNKNDMRQAGEKPLEFLYRVMAQQQESDPYKPYFGFKLMLHHDPRLIDHVLEDLSWEVIVLERQNLLAQWTSAGLAKKTGRWGPGKKAGESKKAEAEDEEEDDDLDELSDDKIPEKAESPKVVFNAEKYEQYCFRMHARYASIYNRLGDRPYFKLFSEEIDASHPALLEFLGVAPVEMQSTRPRQNSSSMRDRIKNYESYVRYARKNSLPVS
jgi:hypothetical protein